MGQVLITTCFELQAPSDSASPAALRVVETQSESPMVLRSQAGVVKCSSQVWCQGQEETRSSLSSYFCLPAAGDAVPGRNT